MRKPTKALLLQGAKMTGSFVEGIFYIEEQLYSDEFQEAEDFAKWIDKEIGGAGPANIDILYKAFKGDTEALKEAKVIKEKIARIKSHSN